MKEKKNNITELVFILDRSGSMAGLESDTIGDGTDKKPPVRKKESEKVGRNDPCPCGSGKKYKQCCGR